MNTQNWHDEELLADVLGWSRRRDYAGWDYADGLSSPLADLLPPSVPYLDLGVQEAIKRSPINVRPLFRVPKRRSFKGSGLFVSANLAAYRVTGQPQYLNEADRLGRWLLSNRRSDPFGWGHNHPLGTLHGVIDRNTPSIVSTSFVLRGVIDLASYRSVDLPADVPKTVATFIQNDLEYTERDRGASINYRVDDDSEATIINATALGARLLSEVAATYETPWLLDLAGPLYEYVVSQQTATGGWHYTDPPAASHLSMDNHHNGFILESLLIHRRLTGDRRFDAAIDRGMDFYRTSLFEGSGAPRWDESNTYPRDIHAAAQGILTFLADDQPAFARRILSWTLSTLYAGDGRFWYRTGRWYTKRITLMRWCQAWMARAIAALIDDPWPPVTEASTPRLPA